MEIEKKILIVSIFFGFIFTSCNNKKTDFFIKEDKKIDSYNVTQIKSNIYSYKGKLFMAGEYFDRTGLYLHDSINNILISNILDIKSYKEVHPYLLYKDKNNVYFFDKERGCIHCLKLLNVDANTFNVLDKDFEYASDKNKIFCLRYGEEINTEFPKTFKVIKLNNIVLGIDYTSIYSMCEPMSPEYFKKNFESVSYKIRDSIVKKYFK